MKHEDAHSVQQEENQGAQQMGAHKPGPYLISIDYDALYAMEEPPAYEPWDVYGWFLLSVAAQQTPMAWSPWVVLPDHVVKTADVVFKEVDGVQLALDVYREKGIIEPRPLILIIHGGYWKSGDKAVHTQQGIEFVELGYTVASVNYRLSAEHKFPAAIEDIYDAMKFLTAHAIEYNIDPGRIVTYGGSAGGHLSAFIGLAANTPGKAYNEGINASAIKGVISLYGIHDLTLPIQREHPFTQQFIGRTYEEDPAAYREASPVQHADENDPPVLLIHGSLDGSISVQNSDALSAKLTEIGVNHTYDRVEGWSHAMDLFSPIGERSLWHIYQFLKANMPSGKLKETG